MIPAFFARRAGILPRDLICTGHWPPDEATTARDIIAGMAAIAAGIAIGWLMMPA